MANDGNDAAAKVFMEILERQAFLFAEPAEAADLEPGGREFLGVSMGFRGEIQGGLHLALPQGMAVEVAANVLGADVDDPAAMEGAADACRELLNVLCGNLLTELRGEEPVFDLSIPKVEPMPEDRFKELAGQEGTLAFLVDDHPVLFRLDLSGSAASWPAGAGGA